MSGGDRQRLGATGQVYVTLAAAEAFATFRRARIEEARRELTELLLDATEQPVSRDGDERWRFRRPSARCDVQAQVSREGPLAVVTHVHVRRYP